MHGLKKLRETFLVLTISAFMLAACGPSGGIINSNSSSSSSGNSSGGPSTFTVTYNGNGNTGGSVPIDSTNYAQGQTVTVLGNTGNLVKTSFSFSGWNTQPDGSGTTYSPTQTFIMGAANVTLYAMWTTNVRYAYVANYASINVSQYTIGANGTPHQ